MSNTTYSREFLKGYKDECNRKTVDAWVSNWSGEILTKAREGHTEWSCDIGAWRRGQERSVRMTHLPAYVPTDADLAEGFLRKFPGCDVVFSEDWFEVRTGTRELQTRITLSWK
jgi:hypothetical protein